MQDTTKVKGQLQKLAKIQVTVKDLEKETLAEVQAEEHYMQPVYRSTVQMGTAVKARIDQLTSWLTEAEATNEAEAKSSQRAKDSKTADVKSELVAKTDPELDAIIATVNADPKREDKDKIVIKAKASKSDKADAIMAANGYTQAPKPEPAKQPVNTGASTSLGSL